MLVTELVAEIISEVKTRPDLLNLRLVSYQFGALATPAAFRRVEVKGTVTGAEKLAQLQESDLAEFVRGLEFIHEVEDEDTNTALSKTFSALAKFPMLKKLVFSFCPVYSYSEEDEREDITSSVQHALIGALVNNPLPPLLSSLSLVNVVTLYDEVFKEDSFRQLMQKLKSFSLATLTDSEIEESRMNPSYERFWDENVPEHILTPSSTLISLSIKSSRMEFLYPDPSDSLEPLFPNLAHLALTGILFSDGMKEFILDHSGSLTHLELDDCQMMDEDVPPDTTNTWKQMFSRIEEEMEHLVLFSFTHSSGLNVSESGDYFIDGWVLDPNEVVEEEEEVDELFRQDELALHSLEMAVLNRSFLKILSKLENEPGYQKIPDGDSIATPEFTAKLFSDPPAWLRESNRRFLLLAKSQSVRPAHEEW